MQFISFYSLLFALKAHYVTVTA